MRILTLLLVSMIVCCRLLVAQEAAVQLAKDTVLMDNLFEVKFHFKNVDDGQYIAPDFGDDFEVVYGPSQQSSVRIVGNERSSKISYGYFLKPVKPGTFMLPLPRIKIEEGGEVKADSIKITVIPNPEGVQQDQTIGDDDIGWQNESLRPKKRSQSALPRKSDRRRISL